MLGEDIRMIQVMTREQAAKRGLFTVDPLTGKQVPFGCWRMELTDEQREEHQRMLDAGEVEF